MSVEQLVEGPAWTGHELDESAGRYPLRIEAAVFNLVSTLLPGVITTTRQARMYSLHALAWAEAEERGLDTEGAEEFVRRCEVVAAGIYYHHDAHRIELSSAHAEDRIPLFESEAGLDVERAAKRDGLSSAGFANVYVGPCVGLGLLTQSSPPRRGERVGLKSLQAGLGDLVALGDRDVIPIADLAANSHLCLCSGFDSPDGLWLRRVLFEETPREDDRRRQLSALMLIETLLEEETDHPDGAFRRRWGFGSPQGDPESDERVRLSLAWRAAILRNYSVTAWRSLWSWLGEQLNQEPMTVEQLGDRLAEAVADQTVAELLAGLPPRTNGGGLLYKALIAGLERARRPHGINRIRVFADSTLVVNTVNGDSNLEPEDLKDLCRKAGDLVKE